MVDYDGLSYTAFHEWFEPGFVVLIREILDEAMEKFDTGRNDLNGRPESVRDVFIADAIPSSRCTKKPPMSMQQPVTIRQG